MNENTKKQYIELESACSSGDLDKVKKLLNKENINGLKISNNPIYPPLESAITMQRYDVVEYLLEQGAEPNLIIDTGGTGLAYIYNFSRRLISGSGYLHDCIYQEYEHYAFEVSYRPVPEGVSIKSLELLVKYGANVNLKNELGETPLDVALDDYFPNTEAERFLRSIGGKTSEELTANDVYYENKEIYLELLEACRLGNIEIVKNNLNQDIINGFPKMAASSPLMFAIYFHQYEIIEYLLKKGANSNILFNGIGLGRSPYVIFGTEILNDVSALHCVIDIDGPIYEFDAYYEDKISTKSLEMLIKYGADVNLKNEKGETPLDVAIINKNYPAEKILKEHGAKHSKKFLMEDYNMYRPNEDITKIDYID